MMSVINHIRHFAGWALPILLVFYAGRPPLPPSGRSMSALSFGAEVSSLRQEDLVVTDNTDCLQRRCLCFRTPTKPLPAFLPSTSIHGGSPSHAETPKAIQRGLSCSLAVDGSLRHQASPLRCTPRTYGKGIDIYLPSKARHFSHLATRSHATLRAIIRLVQCL